jgi:hypothetical protein
MNFNSVLEIIILKFQNIQSNITYCEKKIHCLQKKNKTAGPIKTKKIQILSRGKYFDYKRVKGSIKKRKFKQ